MANYLLVWISEIYEIAPVRYDMSTRTAKILHPFFEFQDGLRGEDVHCDFRNRVKALGIFYWTIGTQCMTRSKLHFPYHLQTISGHQFSMASLYGSKIPLFPALGLPFPLATPDIGFCSVTQDHKFFITTILCFYGESMTTGHHIKKE